MKIFLPAITFVFSLLLTSDISAQELESTTGVEPGFYLATELVGGLGVGNVIIDNSVLDANYERTFGLRALAAHLSPSGLSIGATAFYDYYSESSFLLIGADVRYFFSRAQLAPFINGNAGYGIAFGEERDGGFYYHPALGARLRVKPDFEIIFSVGYKNQQFSEINTAVVEENGATVFVDEVNDFRVGFLVATLGIVF